MVVNRADSVKTETLQDWIEDKFDFEISGDEKYRNGIVHRLDRDTSGVLVVAKTKEKFVELQQQFKQRKVEKIYLALLHGKLEPREGVMQLPLGRNEANRKQFTVVAGGKLAETRWNVIKYLERAGQWYSLAELYPKTGRTHQLRVHLKHLNHPIVSDVFYLSKKRIKSDLDWCPRLFLHASKLCFYLKGKKRCFEAELAGDLKTVLEKLGD